MVSPFELTKNLRLINVLLKTAITLPRPAIHKMPKVSY